MVSSTAQYVWGRDPEIVLVWKYVDKDFTEVRPLPGNPFPTTVNPGIIPAGGLDPSITIVGSLLVNNTTLSDVDRSLVDPDVKIVFVVV